MRNNDHDVWVGLFTLIIGVMALVGWGLNIYKLWGVETLDVRAILRIAGIFVGPLGAVLGYI